MSQPTKVSALLFQIGEEICHLRIGLGMTQSTLGEALGITQHQIQRYEAGQSSLSIERLVAIADALGVEPRHFFGRGSMLPNPASSTALFGDPDVGFCTKDDLALAVKIAQIRSDRERQDIIVSISETVGLLLSNQSARV